MPTERETQAQKLARLEALLSRAVSNAYDVMSLFGAMLSLPVEERYRSWFMNAPAFECGVPHNGLG